MAEKNIKLNKEQTAAVNHGEGPLLIIAGAGTGKTTVITERITRLITSEIISPSEVLALTFTEKAALEMETRIDEALPLGYTQMWVKTFHGFCDAVLRENAIHIGLDPAYKLLTTAESIDLLKRNIFELGLSYFLPLGNPTKFLFGLLNHFSRLQDEDVSPRQYVDWSVKQTSESQTEQELLEIKMWQELAVAYRKYDGLKIANSFMDFGDLLTKTLQLFRSRPNVLSSYQQKFKYILVDEFQDTNYAQNELTMLLAGKNGNLTVVGDDDQSIYRFRGAAVSNMLSFKKHFPEAKIVTLTQNFRSKQQILDTAYQLITHNNPDRLEVVENIDKKLKAIRTGDGLVELCVTNHAHEEAEFVADTVLRLQKEDGRAWGDFAVLVRANNHAESFIRSFEQLGIPFQFLGPGKLFLEDEILDLISYLRAITLVSDSQSIYRVLSMSIFKIPSVVVAKMSSRARKESVDLFDIAVEVSAEDDLVKAAIDLVQAHLSRAATEPAGTILYDFVHKSGLMELVLADETAEGVRKAENIAKFFTKVKAFEVTNPGATVQAVVDWITLQSDLGESPQAAEIDWTNTNAVNILTIHSSKGLEFPVVFLVNLVSQRFPSTRRSEQIPIPDDFIRETLPSTDYHLQEERRLAYVGMTRAKDQLYLTAAKFYSEKREKKLSPFISEALGAVNPRSFTSSAQKQVVIHEPQEVEKHMIKSLSYSQIEAFDICPLHYKLRYLLKIPTPPSAAQSFGISFHATLKDFHEAIRGGVEASHELLDELLAKQWVKTGYLNREHREESYKKAQRFLQYYLDEYYKPEAKTVAVEQDFSIRLRNLSLRGKIDRVDETEHGIHIIDYKTGKVMSQKDADKSLQLSIYALAATKIPQYPFNRSSEEITLSLYYFNEPEVITTHRTQKQLDEAVKEIFEWKTKIETSDFTCSGNFLCRDCEYKMYCRAASE